MKRGAEGEKPRLVARIRLDRRRERRDLGAADGERRAAQAMGGCRSLFGRDLARRKSSRLRQDVGFEEREKVADERGIAAGPGAEVVEIEDGGVRDRSLRRDRCLMPGPSGRLVAVPSRAAFTPPQRLLKARTKRLRFLVCTARMCQKGSWWARVRRPNPTGFGRSAADRGDGARTCGLKRRRSGILVLSANRSRRSGRCSIEYGREA